VSSYLSPTEEGEGGNRYLLNDPILTLGKGVKWRPVLILGESRARRRKRITKGKEGAIDSIGRWKGPVTSFNQHLKGKETGNARSRKRNDFLLLVILAVRPASGGRNKS